MRACMLGYTLYETDNRVRRYAETLARQGHEVDVFSLRQPSQSPEGELRGVRIHRLQVREFNEKRKTDYLTRILRFLVNSGWAVTRRHLRKRYDLLHVHSVPDFEVFAAFVPKLTGAKVILDIHDMVPEFYAEKFSKGRVTWLVRALRLVEKMCCGFADHVVISNDLWRGVLTKRSVREDKCTVFLNYPDPSLFRQFREKRANGRFVMVYPGTFAWHQGLDIAVQAMARLRDQVPGAELHLYGAGPEETRLRELVSGMGLAHCVFFHGLVPLDMIADKMIDADLGIVPKRNEGFGNEAFSTKTLEFMALGVPLLLSRTTVDQFYFNDDLVAFCQPGSVDDFVNKVIMLSKDPEWRQRLSRNGLEHVRENNWEVKGAEYLSLVDRLVGRRG